MPRPGGILGADDGRRGRREAVMPGAAVRSAREHRGGRKPGCEPCSRSRTATAYRRLARDLRRLDVEIFATDGTREHLAADGIEVGSVSDLTARARRSSAARSRRSTRRSTPASSPGATSRPSSPSSPSTASASIDIVVVNVKPFAPQVGAQLVALDEAIEMIDVGGAALLGAAARN